MKKVLILMLISWLMTGCWLIPNEPIDPLWPSRDDKDKKGKYLLTMIKHPTFTNTLFYNNKGQLTYEEKDGKLTYIYEYDEMGRIWRRTEATPREGEDGPYLHYHQLLYNDLGQVVGEEENGKKEYWPGRNHSAVYC